MSQSLENRTACHIDMTNSAFTTGMSLNFAGMAVLMHNCGVPSGRSSPSSILGNCYMSHAIIKPNISLIAVWIPHLQSILFGLNFVQLVLPFDPLRAVRLCRSKNGTCNMLCHLYLIGSLNCFCIQQNNIFVLETIVTYMVYYLSIKYVLNYLQLPKVHAI